MLYLAVLPAPFSSIYHFKNEPLGVRGKYFQDFNISMIPTNSKNFKKNL